ncbi:MAG: hypothetical protein GY707_16580 [Desulfobacteraceae bacterium]|nr:hypothetical protein [Desulfobacteraceae bacterium]
MSQQKRHGPSTRMEDLDYQNAPFVVVFLTRSSEKLSGISQTDAIDYFAILNQL